MVHLHTSLSSPKTALGARHGLVGHDARKHRARALRVLCAGAGRAPPRGWWRQEYGSRLPAVLQHDAPVRYEPRCRHWSRERAGTVSPGCLLRRKTTARYSCVPGVRPPSSSVGAPRFRCPWPYHAAERRCGRPPRCISSTFFSSSASTHVLSQLKQQQQQKQLVRCPRCSIVLQPPHALGLGAHVALCLLVLARGYATFVGTATQPTSTLVSVRESAAARGVRRAERSSAPSPVRGPAAAQCIQSISSSTR